MEHKSQAELGDSLRAAKAKIAVGDRYVHYKHPELAYKIIGFAIWEATDEVAVLYEAQYGEHVAFARPLEVWLETVEWQGKLVPRFSKVAG